MAFLFEQGNRPHNIKDTRIKVWGETEGVSQRLPHPPKSVKHTFQSDHRPQKKYEEMDVRVTKEDTIVAARHLMDEGLRPLVLNMADDVFSGGCVSTGSGAQEESLFRRMNYCVSLHNDPRKNRFYPIAHDEAVYSPGITVFRSTEDTNYRFLNRPFKLDFIACPGIKYPVLDDTGHLLETDTTILEQKIRLILQVGQDMGHDSLVLGALRCGAWNNTPGDVAACFERILSKYPLIFKVIVFAILSVTDYDSKNYEIFRDKLD